ncbi:hypothetical protein TGRH88_029020 [Toxoplasma gondii]|uniref:Transmembrane protein n=1 Tax=Toxoplasma gondii TaxID=5811 RepID=A0A7J6K706_TOXGO|nr:hypothetical protein TGRH88_029020 [Toxoplasma gondii]
MRQHRFIPEDFPLVSPWLACFHNQKKKNDTRTFRRWSLSRKEFQPKSWTDSSSVWCGIGLIRVYVYRGGSGKVCREKGEDARHLESEEGNPSARKGAAPLSRLSLVLVDWLSPLPGSSSPSCFASEEEDGGAQSRDPDREEERPSEGSPRTEKTGDACRGQRGEASPSVARLPSSLLSLLHAIWTNCFLGSCHAEATRASLAGDRNASTLLPSSPLSSSSASEVFSRRSNLSVSRPPSLCEGVLLLPCSLLLLLGILRVAPLLLMFLSNALLLHCQFRALLESATAFVPSVLTFVFNFLLSGCFSVVVFGEAVSLRWLAGAGAMLTGVGLLMRATADEGTRKAGEKKVRKID